MVLVFDVTCRETFEALGYWYKQVECSRGIGEAPVILVGNKIDVGGAAVWCSLKRAAETLSL